MGELSLSMWAVGCSPVSHRSEMHAPTSYEISLERLEWGTFR